MSHPLEYLKILFKKEKEKMDEEFAEPKETVENTPEEIEERKLEDEEKRAKKEKLKNIFSKDSDSLKGKELWEQNLAIMSHPLEYLKILFKQEKEKMDREFAEPKEDIFEDIPEVDVEEKTPEEHKRSYLSANARKRASKKLAKKDSSKEDITTLDTALTTNMKKKPTAYNKDSMLAIPAKLNTLIKQGKDELTSADEKTEDELYAKKEIEKEIKSGDSIDIDTGLTKEDLADIDFSPTFWDNLTTGITSGFLAGLMPGLTAWLAGGGAAAIVGSIGTILLTAATIGSFVAAAWTLWNMAGNLIEENAKDKGARKIVSEEFGDEATKKAINSVSDRTAQEKLDASTQDLLFGETLSTEEERMKWAKEQAKNKILGKPYELNILKTKLGAGLSPKRGFEYRKVIEAMSKDKKFIDEVTPKAVKELMKPLEDIKPSIPFSDYEYVSPMERRMNEEIEAGIPAGLLEKDPDEYYRRLDEYRAKKAIQDNNTKTTSKVLGSFDQNFKKVQSDIVSVASTIINNYNYNGSSKGEEGIRSITTKRSEVPFTV